jgi:hypothetical protein
MKRWSASCASGERSRGHQIISETRVTLSARTGRQLGHRESTCSHRRDRPGADEDYETKIGLDRAPVEARCGCGQPGTRQVSRSFTTLGHRILELTGYRACRCGFHRLRVTSLRPRRIDTDGEQPQTQRQLSKVRAAPGCRTRSRRRGRLADPPVVLSAADAGPWDGRCRTVLPDRREIALMFPIVSG